MGLTSCLAVFKKRINKRQLLSLLLSKLGLFPILRYWGARKPSFKILAYHRVADIDRSTYLFDEHLVDATVSDFDKQMCHLSKNYTLKPLSEGYAEFKKKGESNIVSITFDDGFDDLYFNIFPILKKYNIRPTMFLTTGLIGTNQTLWSEQVVYALKVSKGKSLCIESLYGGREVLIDSTTMTQLIFDILHLLKRALNDERVKIMSELFVLLDIDPDAVFAESRMVTWDMVREMAAWGVEFGSHSVNHPVLSTLSEEDMRKELSQSKEKIEHELGAECQTLAYPVGGDDAFNELVLSAAQEGGYAMACSYLSGVVNSDCHNKFALKRLHVDHTVQQELYAAILATPALFATDFHSD